MEPFTGESLALPLPPETRRRHKGDAYCFGFDPGSRRYKIVHKGFQDGPAEQAVHVCTVGGGESWRSVHVAGGETHRGPACADGAVYWIVAGEDRETRIARLDLATEEVTWRDAIGWRDVAGGHVRRGRTCPAARGGRLLGLDCGIFGGGHIYSFWELGESK